jgi:hypothetical protein
MLGCVNPGRLPGPPDSPLPLGPLSRLPAMQALGGINRLMR